MKIEHKILHGKFQKYGTCAREWTRKCALLLPEIEKHRIWEQKKFGSIYEYACKLAGMGRPAVDDALRVLKKIEDKPDLRKVVELKGINAVRPVAAIATRETQSFWAEKAMAMSKNTLEVYVKDLTRSTDLTQQISTNTNLENNLCTSTEKAPRTSGQQAISLFDTQNFEIKATQKTVVMQLSPEIADQLEKLKGQGDWNELMKQFLELRSLELEEQKPEPVQATSRHIPVKIQQHVTARTNGNCSHPGCAKPIEIKHHTKRFALEKNHDPDQIHGLCKEHERIAHLGLIENEEATPADWKVRKEADPDEPKFKIDELVKKFRTGGLAFYPL